MLAVPPARFFSVVPAVVVAALILSGSVGDPTPRGFVTFDEIRRAEFTALAVKREHAAPSAAPLLVRVNVIGDGADADSSVPERWLREHVNVILVHDPTGAPLYLTHENLVATSGPAALGATVRSGMAVEMRDDAIAPCVLAHEVLHFLGLHHVDDRGNLMYPRCGPGKLDDATLTDEQREGVARLATITAVTPFGLRTCASRAP